MLTLRLLFPFRKLACAQLAEQLLDLLTSLSLSQACRNQAYQT